MQAGKDAGKERLMFLAQKFRHLRSALFGDLEFVTLNMPLTAGWCDMRIWLQIRRQQGESSRVGTSMIQASRRNFADMQRRSAGHVLELQKYATISGSEGGRDRARDRGTQV